MSKQDMEIPAHVYIRAVENQQVHIEEKGSYKGVKHGASYHHRSLLAGRYSRRGVYVLYEC